MLQKVKDSLGITKDRKNAEIYAAIEAAKQELHAAGVEYIDEQDDLTAAAIVIYCRYWFNFQGEAQRHYQQFERMKNTMCCLQKYKAGECDEV